MLISRPQKYKKTSNKTTCKQSSIILRPVRVSRVVVARSKRHPSDGPFHFWRNGSLHRSRRWHCPRGVLPARRRASVIVSTSWQAFVARSKDTPRTALSISGEMVPSIVAEDGIALGVYCRLAEGQRHCFDFVAGFCRSQQRHPSDGPFHFWRNGSLHRSRRWHCPRGVLPARRRASVIISQPEKHL